MLKKVILTTLKCVGIVFLSVLLIFTILSALGFSTYTVSESSYKLPDKLSVGVALVFTPTYRETVLTAPTWFKKPEVGDQIIYESNIARLGELTCIGWIKEADGDSYHIENPKHLYGMSITIGNETSINFCRRTISMKDIKGVVVLRAEDRALIPSLIASITILSSAFSITLSYFIFRKTGA